MLYMTSARWLIPRLGEHGLVLLGTSLLACCSLVIGFTPYAWTTLPASLLAGYGFFMFHNTMQTNATQMSPMARGTAVSLFASALFLGQALGALLAAALVTRLGSGSTIALAGGVLLALGAGFAWALRRRQRVLLAGELAGPP